MGEICDYGERQYYSMVHTFTASPADMKWQLDDLGVDYTKISDFELFYGSLYKGLTKEMTFIVFGELNLSSFEMAQQDDKIILYDYERDIIIDEYTYLLIADILRQIHGLVKNNQIPGNETTKRILIEDARDEYLMNQGKEYQSQLKNLISAMINSEGFKYNHSEVWNMEIAAFMDSVKRITKIKNANLLLQSGYSGYGISLEKINAKQIDWLGEL